jgi:hypothetical protein
MTSLQIIADQGFNDLMEEYLASGNEATLETLHAACGKGHVPVSLQLLSANMDANARDVGPPSLQVLGARLAPAPCELWT